MIQQVQLRHFGKHKKVNVTFTNGVNSIVGPSYKGKTTILRALLWCLHNQPPGTSMIQWGSQKAAVRTILSNQILTRTRTNTKNIYELDGKVFEAFPQKKTAGGNNVPSEITNVVNMEPEVNWQHQHDSPYWLGLSAGKVSRRMNAIINLDIMDKMLKVMNEKVRTGQWRCDESERKIKEFQINFDSLQYVEEMNVNLGKLESLEQETRKIAEKAVLMADLIKRVHNLTLIQKNRLGQASRAKFLASVALNKEEIATSTQNLQNLIKTVESIKVQIQRRPPSIKHLQALYDRIQNKQIQTEKLSSLIRVTLNRKERLCQSRNREESAQQRLDKHRGTRCPLCLRPWKKSGTTS